MFSDEVCINLNRNYQCENAPKLATKQFAKVFRNLSLILQIGEDLVMVNKFDSFEPVNGQQPPTEVRKISALEM